MTYYATRGIILCVTRYLVVDLIGKGEEMDVQLKRGLLDVCVLAVLKQGESYGYKIISELSPYIEICESTLYPILKRLEKSGCVTTRTAEHNGRLRKYYMITQMGKHKINEFLSDMDEFVKVHEFIRRRNV